MPLLFLFGALFGGFWFATQTDAGRGLLGNLGEFFSGFRGYLGFLFPSLDADGQGRESVIRNGNMGLIRQGLSRFGGVPDEMVQAIAGGETNEAARATFNEFLNELGPDAVSAIARDTSAVTLRSQVTPERLSRVLGNPTLAPRILDAAGRLASRGGAVREGSLEAHIQTTALDLLFKPENAPHLDAAFRRNPQLIAQAGQLVRQAAGAENASLVAALTATPDVTRSLLAAARESGIDGRALLNPNQREAAITSQALTAILSRPELAQPILAHAAAQPAGASVSPLARRVQAAAIELLTPAQQPNLRRILAGNPGLLLQIIPLAAGAAPAAGASNNTEVLARALTNPVILNHLQQPQHQQALLTQLRERGTTLNLSPETVDFLGAPAQGGGTNLQVLVGTLTHPSLRGENGQLRSEAQALLASLTGGPEGRTPAALSNHVLNLVRVPGSEGVIAELRNLGPLPGGMGSASTALAALTPGNVALLRATASDAQGRAFLQAATPLLADAQNLTPERLAPLVMAHPQRTMQLLRDMDISGLPMESWERLQNLQDFARQRTASGEMNADVMARIAAHPALRGENGQLAPQASQLLQAVTAKPNERDLAQLAPALLGLAGRPGVEGLVQDVRALNLQGYEGAAQAVQALTPERVAAVASLATPQNIALIQDTLPRLSEEQRSRVLTLANALGQGNPGETMAQRAVRSLGEISGLLQENREAALHFVTRFDVSGLPEPARAQAAEVQQTLVRLHNQPSRVAGQSNLDVLAQVVHEPYMQTGRGRELLQQLASGNQNNAQLLPQLLGIVQDPQALPVLQRLGQLTPQQELGAARNVAGLLTPNNVQLLRDTLPQMSVRTRERLAAALSGQGGTWSGIQLLRDPHVSRLLNNLEITHLDQETQGLITRARRGVTGMVLGSADAQEQSVSSPGNTASLTGVRLAGITGGDSIPAGSDVPSQSTPAIAEAHTPRLPRESGSLLG